MDETPQSQSPVTPEPVQPEVPVEQPTQVAPEMSAAPIVVPATGLSAKAIGLMVALGVIVIGGAGYLLFFKNSSSSNPSSYNQPVTGSSNKGSFTCKDLISDVQIEQITGQSNVTFSQTGTDAAVSGLNSIPGQESNQLGNQAANNGGQQIGCWYAYTQEGIKEQQASAAGGDVGFSVTWGGNFSRAAFDSGRSIIEKASPEAGQDVPGIGSEAYYSFGELRVLSSNGKFEISIRGTKDLQEKIAKIVDSNLSKY